MTEGSLPPVPHQPWWLPHLQESQNLKDNGVSLPSQQATTPSPHSFLGESRLVWPQTRRHVSARVWTLTPGVCAHRERKETLERRGTQEWRYVVPVFLLWARGTRPCGFGCRPQMCLSDKALPCSNIKQTSICLGGREADISLSSHGVLRTTTIWDPQQYSGYEHLQRGKCSPGVRQEGSHLKGRAAGRVTPKKGHLSGSGRFHPSLHRSFQKWAYLC